MAIMNGNDIIGLVGNIVIKQGKDGKKIVQTKARQYKQNKESTRTSKMFGYGSSVASVIRHQLDATFGSNYDSSMINRFNNPIREVLGHCYNPADKTFIFEEDSFSRLAEFEFNIKSPLINHLWVKPTMTLEGNMLKVSIPEFKVPSQFTFPRKTNNCKVSITISKLNISQALTGWELYHTFEVSAAQEIHPSQELVFEVENECLCVAVIGLFYSQKDNGSSTNYNSKAFGPANVIGAVIIPGVYVEPPTPPISHSVSGREWTFESKLQF